MKVHIFNGFWKVYDVKKYNNYIFVYGDNDKKHGLGGQAIIRNEINTHGIPTKKCPDCDASSYYTDDEFEENKIKINNAIDTLIKRLESGYYNGIILPENGLGTGLAKLPKKAPKTFQFLNKRMDELKKLIESMD
jgi:hypothetical protein